MTTLKTIDNSRFRGAVSNVAGLSYPDPAGPDASQNREHHMGASKRYADQIDRRMNESIARRIMQSGPPQSLGNQELELDTTPLTRAPKPVKVRVWVRYPDGPIEVDAEAVAWTTRAIAVRWGAGDGLHRAWVWASAVDGAHAR